MVNVTDALVHWLLKDEPGRLLLTGKPAGGKSCLLRFITNKIEITKPTLFYLDLALADPNINYGICDMIGARIKTDPHIIELALRQRVISVLVDHYELLEEVIGKKRMYLWEQHHLKGLFCEEKREGKSDLGPRVVIACDQGYYDRRGHIGLFYGSFPSRLEDLESNHPKYRRVKRRMLEYLEKKLGHLRYFFPDSVRIADVENRIQDLSKK